MSMFVTFLLLFCVYILWHSVNNCLCMKTVKTAFKGFKRNYPFLASLKKNQTSLGEKNEDSLQDKNVTATPEVFKREGSVNVTWLKVGLLCNLEHRSPCLQAPILK